MRVEFHPEANLELIAAHAWLEGEGLGLGDALAESVEEVLRRLRRFPFSGPPVRLSGVPADVRQMVVRRFLYVVIYRVRGEALQVLAVAHTRRRPGYWRKRLA